MREIIKLNLTNNCFPLKTPVRQTKKFLNEVNTYLVNQAKFKAANEYCDDRRMKFRILTEEEILPKNEKIMRLISMV